MEFEYLVIMRLFYQGFIWILKTTTLLNTKLYVTIVHNIVIVYRTYSCSLR